MNKILSSMLAILLTALSTNFALFADVSNATTLTKPLDQEATTLEQYKNSEKNYSISYPNSWRKSDAPRLDLVLFAPPKGSDANSHASMNIVSEKVDSGVTLDQFYKESASNLKTALEDVVVEKSGDANLNGVPTKWVLYTHVMQNIKFRVLQYFIVAENNLYLVTFSSVADSFEDYRNEFDKIAKSFKLLNTSSLSTKIEKQVTPASQIPATVK